MTKTQMSLFKCIDLIVILTMLLGGVTPALAQDPQPTPEVTPPPLVESNPTQEPTPGPDPTIQSDKLDYLPGELVTLTGSNWQGDTQVHIYVEDNLGKTWSRDVIVDVAADGTILDTFTLPTWFVANYMVLASGVQTVRAVTSYFSDLNIGLYDQCSNDTGTGYTSGDTGCRWINGNLQRNNSVYFEGDATVQRLWLTDFVPGTTHTVTLTYGTTKGGKHAYDFLTTWDWSEDWITLADRCQDITGCTTAGETYKDIPADPNAVGFDAAAGTRQFVMRGGTLTGATTPTIVSGAYTGDSETSIKVSFTVANSGDMCSTKGGTTTCGVALWFGAHVAVGGQWYLHDKTTGAGSISGSPYHVALSKVDDASVGQRDNQMQAEVITFIPNGTIVIIKDAIPNDAQDFNFNLNNNSTIDLNFALDDDADATLPNSQTFSVPPGTWYASELMPLPAGWSLSSLVCVDPTNNTTVNGAVATINLASLETVTCTYTDVKGGHIIVKKETIGGDGSFEFDPSWGDNFFLSNGQSNDSGSLAAGTYDVAEVNLPSTWSLTSATCDDGSPVSAISLQEGETVTCTFVNTRVYNKDLEVTKTATASFGRLYKWLIDKSVKDTVIKIPDGGIATFDYSVKVTPDGYDDSTWLVAGKITVANPNDFAVAGVNVTDAIDNGDDCSVTDGMNVTVPANESVVLDYSCTYASAPSPAAGTNTATAVWDKDTYNTPHGSASGSAGVDFSTVTPSETNKVITVIDDKTDPLLPITLGTWNWADGVHTFTYSLEKQGVAGTCTDYTNTAVIDETKQSDKQTVTVCVGKDMSVSKTATASKSRLYKWLIDKSVDDTQIEIAEGGTATFNYSVKVTPDGFVDSGYTLGGTITIINPNDWEDVTVDVTDILDQGGSCSITEAAPYVVLQLGSLFLHYTCSTDGTTTKNTATVTWDKDTYFTPTGSASADADVSFALGTETNKVIKVIDDQTDPTNPVELGTSDYDAGPFEFTYSLDKKGVAGTCTDYTNTAVIDETKQSDSQKVTVCVGKDLTVSKTAAGTFDRTYLWTISKDVDKTTVNIANGGKATFNYTVEVAQTGISDSGWTLSGKITVSNPNDWEDITLTGLSDVVDNGGLCTVDAGPYVIPASGLLEVNYSCSFGSAPSSYSGINTATATWDKDAAHTPNGTASGTAGFSLSQAGSTNKTVNVTDTLGGDLGFVTATDSAPFASKAFPYSLDFTGVGGVCTKYDNTATITETKQEASQTVEVCVGLDLTVSKTAIPTFNRTWDWTITKDFDATYNLFAGASVTHGYKITVTPNSTDSAFKVVGTITVSNPNAWEDIQANLSDVVDNGGTCYVEETVVIVPAGSYVEVPYMCSWGDKPTNYSGTNTATASWDAALYFTPSGTASGSANFQFANPKEFDPEITVDDTNVGYEHWSANRAYAEWTYTKDFTCSSEPSDYLGDGKYDYFLTNTAKINETGQTDTATVIVNCYAPVVSKTAAGTYDERHEWDVTKSVFPASQSAFAGDTVSYEWKVIVKEDTFEENFKAGGAITVVNPAPMAMTVALSDTLGGGTVSAIGACTDGIYFEGNLTIPANTTAVCAYTAEPGGRVDDMNYVTATLNGIDFKASASFGWTPNVIRGSVSLDDDQNPAFPLTLTDGNTFTYSEQYTCSVDKSSYDPITHKYTFSENNIATLKEGETTLDQANASTSVDCYVPVISKDANGKYDEMHDWEVFKSVNTASQTAFAGEKKNFTWTVRVDETTHGENYVVTGKITVVNPNPEDALGIALGDKLDDGSLAAIGPCIGGTWSDPILTVPAGGTATCDYSVTPKGDLTLFAAALPATVTMKVEYPFTGGPAYFPVVTVSGDGALNGTYEGWCADIDHTIAQNTNYSANVYSSYESLPAGIIEKAYNLDLVNWIINQDFVGKPAGGSLGNYTYGDVQRAIWELIEDNGTSNTSGLGAWNQTRVNQIKAAAMANGEGFTPTCGDWVAVILQPVGGQQLVTIAQVTFASLGINCAGSNVATAVLNGIEFPASAQILWTVTKVNETASLDDDQKLDWPTTVSADTTFSYQDPQGYTCSTNPAAYTNGYYQYNESNTAVLTYSTGFDTATASTAVKCYAPVVTKTAAGAYDERHEWDVEKSVDPLSQDVLAGSTGNFVWTVKVTESVFEENFAASGTISVKNPRPDDGNMTVKLSDVLNDTTVPTITGCTGGTWNATNKTVAVPPNTTAVCSYSGIPAGRSANLNTVTAELMAGTIHLVTSATANLAWTANVIRGSATLDDDQNPKFPLEISDGGTWTYADKYTCSTNQGDYTNGSYTYPESNTATVTSGEISDSASANTEVICHAPVVTKDVTTYFNRDWDWTIVKDYDDTYDLFAGGSVTHGYKVSVTPTYTDNFWGAKGNITITNSHPTQPMVLTSVSDLAGGITAPVTCPNGSLVVPAAGTLTCTYDTGPQTAPNANPFGATNTATAVFAAANWTGSAPIVFSKTPTTEDEPVITVDDNNLNGEAWSADRAYAEWIYTRDFACSTDPGVYADGKYSYSLTNTAEINETEQTDTARVDVNCFAPKVTKTAQTYWNRDWDWTITKEFDGSYNLFAGDTVTHGYKVSVTPTYTDNLWGVKGSITVYNAHPTEAMTLTSLTDLAGGIIAPVTCPNGSLVVPAAGSLTCTYDTGAQDALNANPFGPTNIATAVFAAANWTGTAGIVFSDIPTTRINPTVHVDDDNLTGENWTTTKVKGEWTYSKDFTCSTNPDDYKDGKYSYSLTNTAEIIETHQTDTAKVDVTCYSPQIEITKTGDALSKIGDKVHYNITLFNNTPTDAGLRDLSCTITDPKISFNKTVTLASGVKDENLNIEFTIPSTASDPFYNKASVTCKPVAATAPVVGDSTFSVSDYAIAGTNLFQPKVEIIKTGPLYATSGDVITYTFTINNLSSSDSPNLMLDSVSDDVLGDLKSIAVAAGCDNLVYNGTCTFTKTYTVPNVGLQPRTITNTVTLHTHPAGFPNDVMDTDDHTVTVSPKSQLTDTSFCPLPNNQFRLLYRLQIAPNTYVLNGSNPGQFYMNAFYFGNPGSDFTMTIKVPYPFMTQDGAGVPIQVHDGTNLTSGGCYAPNPMLTGFTITTQAPTPVSAAGNQIITPEDYSFKTLGTKTTVTVSGKVPATGLAYVTIHLDYGLKKTYDWKPSGSSTLNPVTGLSIPDMWKPPYTAGAFTIHGYEVYTFSRTVGGNTSTTTPVSYNEIKKFAGFLGFVFNKNTEGPVAGVKVVIYSPTGAVLATVYTDADGYYMYAYKHTAKSAIYTVKLPGYLKSTSITVKANGFAGIDFEVP